jgi:hypothetical protein
MLAQLKMFSVDEHSSLFVSTSVEAVLRNTKLTKCDNDTLSQAPMNAGA